MSGKAVLIKFEEVKVAVPSKKEEPADEPTNEIDEKALLDKVLQSTTSRTEADTETKKPTSESVTKPSPRPSPSLFMPVAKAVAFFTLLGVGLFIVRRKKLLGSISKLVDQNFKKDKKFIQIVAKYYLDPKKSLILVRVGGRLLLLGSSDDSIQVITEVPENIESEFETRKKSESNETQVTQKIFADLLSEERGRPIDTVRESTRESTVRSRIRNRVEGLKPL
jgi:flagellar biogenesis protein FliO